MRTVLGIILLSFFALPATAAEFDFIKVKGVDNAMFQVGYSVQGALCYVVDRTTGTCFALTLSERPAGLTKIDCEPLKKIEVIKNYIETGRLP